MANQQQANPAHVVTNKVRMSYLHVLKPFKSNDPKQADKDPKYSVTVLIPKGDYATLQRINMAIEAAKQRGASEKYGGSIPPKLTLPLHDGDGPRESDGRPYGQECRGHWVLNTSSYRKPGVVDGNCSPIMDETQIYSGMYGLVSMDFYPFNNSGNKGVACGLCHIMKTEDGEPLAGGSTVEDDFGGGQAYGAPPAQQFGQQPGYPVQPQQYAPPAAAPGYGLPQNPAYPAAPGYPAQQQYTPPVQQYAPPAYAPPAQQAPAQGFQPQYGQQPAAPQYAPPVQQPQQAPQYGQQLGYPAQPQQYGQQPAQQDTGAVMGLGYPQQWNG